MKHKEKDYHSECDASDLIRVAEIKMDKERYEAALAIVRKKSKAIKSVDDLRKKAEEVSKEEDEE